MLSTPLPLEFREDAIGVAFVLEAGEERGTGFSRALYRVVVSPLLMGGKTRA